VGVDDCPAFAALYRGKSLLIALEYDQQNIIIGLPTRAEDTQHHASDN
jgi:hypothetical protein